MARVGLVFGGRSVEHRVSVSSARTVAAALERAGHEVVPLGIARDGSWLDVETSHRAIIGDFDELDPAEQRARLGLQHLLGGEVDVVFPVVHGTWGEDGTLQGLLEMLDLPYVGAGVTASAVAMDKLQCKRVLASCGVPVVDWEAVSATQFERSAAGCLERLARLPPPLFVKPSCGGSSVGVRRVAESRQLADAVAFALQFDGVVLVERAVTGRELECSVLGDEELAASAVGEIVPGNEFYDYEDKYLQDKAELRLPADLPPELTATVQELAVRAFAAVGGAGMARVDFLLDTENRLFVNEINTLPGFTRISMYPKLWELSGVPLPDLVGRLVEIALERHRRRARLDRVIKDWLSGVG